MHLDAERTIHRPAAEVAGFFFDASNNPDWQGGMVSCEWLSPSPIAVGSTYEQRARFIGREVRSTFVVTHLEPGRMIRIETIESTFPIQVERRVEPVDDSSCRVVAHISGGPNTGIWKLLSPVMAGRAQKSVDADYDRLVQLLEL
jgi:hypothetical protein